MQIQHQQTAQQITSGHSVLITGPTGAGKSWLACALAQSAWRCGYSALYQRVPRLQEELRIRHGSGTFGNWPLQLARTDVLVLDDQAMGAIEGATRSDWLEIIDDRVASKTTIITSQFPLSTGMPGSTMPLWPTPSSTA
jgi:DNA replication protein DnaC